MTYWNISGMRRSEIHVFKINRKTRSMIFEHFHVVGRMSIMGVE